MPIDLRRCRGAVICRDQCCLRPAQRGACLNQMDWPAGKCRHQCLPDAAHVLHQGAAPRAKLGNHRVLRLSCQLEHMRQIQPAHLAKQAGNLRCGDEIAGNAKRVAMLIIAGAGIAQTGGHETVNANRPGAADLAGNPVPKCCVIASSDAVIVCSGCHWGRLCRRHGHAHTCRQLWPRCSRYSPAAIMGRHSSWPIVRPPTSSPRCVSGSRTNSTR